jgi:hypothetical protein
VATLFVVGLGVAALFAQGIFSPSKIDGDNLVAYEKGLTGLSKDMVGDFNSTLYALQTAAEGGALAQLSAPQWTDLNASVALMGNKTAKLAKASSGARAREAPGPVGANAGSGTHYDLPRPLFQHPNTRTAHSLRPPMHAGRAIAHADSTPPLTHACLPSLREFPFTQ